ncbi:hypothetical protein JB92DRAFT_2835210 [Gautieria morchelliformis]|nr:hypothetical protein JB92DRAFT_2835210 [Gautieria morchelliformis]
MVDVDGCQTDAVELKAAAAAYLVNGETESRTCRWTCWRQWGSQRHRWELASGGPGSRESAGAGANEATGGSCRLERMRDVDRRAGGVPGMAAAVENLPRGWDFNAGGESRGLGRMADVAGESRKYRWQWWRQWAHPWSAQRARIPFVASGRPSKLYMQLSLKVMEDWRKPRGHPLEYWHHVRTDKQSKNE